MKYACVSVLCAETVCISVSVDNVIVKRLQCSSRAEFAIPACRLVFVNITSLSGCISRNIALRATPCEKILLACNRVCLPLSVFYLNDANYGLPIDGILNLAN